MTRMKPPQRRASGKKRTDVRWGIAGLGGLYTGQWLTRRAAVVGHIMKNRFMDATDYAVKLTIHWTEPPKRRPR